MINSDSEDRKIREWQKDVVKSIASDVSTTTRNTPLERSKPHQNHSELPQVRSSTAPIVVNRIVTSPPIIVTRVRAPEPKPYDDISTKAIIGAVAGATAGAFIAYAMVKGDSDNHRLPQAQERVTYRTIEAPVEYGVSHSRPMTSLPIQDSRWNNGYRGADARDMYIEPAPAKRETFMSSSGRLGGADSQSYKVVSRDGPIMMIDNEKEPRSQTASGRDATGKEDLAYPASTAAGTEVRMARAIPLPDPSQASRYSRATTTTPKDHAKPPLMEPREKVPASVAPHDSISQVSTRMSKGSGRSKHHHSSRHDRDRSASRHEPVYERDRGSKAGSKHKSKMGDMVEDVVSILKGTSIKDSEHRR